MDNVLFFCLFSVLPKQKMQNGKHFLFPFFVFFYIFRRNENRIRKWKRKKETFFVSVSIFSFPENGKHFPFPFPFTFFRFRENEKTFAYSSSIPGKQKRKRK